VFKGYSQEWTWMKGANTVNAYGIYGTLGTASSSNMPGARECPMTWTDNSGNLWMYGGRGHCSFAYGVLSDLWKFDPATNNWTWVNGDNNINQLGVYGTMGVASASNKPGARAFSTTWKDASGNLWLFGGYGYDASGNLNMLNDLWKYNISTDQWTWVSGSNTVDQTGLYGTLGVASSTNNPGGRHLHTGWVDNSGNFWLIGGYGFGISGGIGSLNDLWKYDPSGNTWTWMGGSTSINAAGAYGTLGVSSSTNAPGARYSMNTWKDNSGNLWMFGGMGYDKFSTQGYLNDVWKYNVGTNQWTWIKGAATYNPPAVYGTYSIPSSTINPGGRHVASSWADISGNLYVWGGYGVTTYTPSGQNLNDVWKFDVSANNWTWVRGVSYEIAGNYGTQGVTAVTSNPGSGHHRASWKDGSGNFWLFGGNAYDVNASFTINNDMWKMNPCPAPAPMNVSAFASQNPCTGNAATLTAVSNANSVTWYTVPSGGSSIATGTIYVTPSLSSGTAVTTSYTYYASATNTCGLSLVRTPVVVTSNSIYPVVTTGPVYTVGVSIPYGSTPNSDWYPWQYNFTDPVPAGGVVIGIDLSCDVVDQGWGGSGASAGMYVNDQWVGSPVLQHWWTSHAFTTTGTFSNYVYGGTNNFKMYFVGWSGWQGFINNGYLTIRYQTKTTPPVTACQNTSLTLKGYGANTYTWSGGATDGMPHQLSTTQIYTVTGTNAYGCTDAATLLVNVTPAPTVALSGNTVVCQGGSITEAATVSGASHTFSWNTGSTALSISSTPTISTTFIATAANTVTGCSHSVYRKVIVGASPVVSVSASSNTICAGQNISLAVTATASSYGLNFDGTDDYVETNSSITELGMADFSIEAWIKTTGIDEGILVCTNSNGSWEYGEKAFYINGSGFPVFVGHSNQFINGNLAVNDGNWHHVAVVWDYTTGTSGIAKMYVDGVDQTGFVDFYAGSYNLGTFKIGGSNYNEAPNFFSGYIDDVRIWSTALTATQVSGNMNSCLTGTEYGLKAYYRFEDGPNSPSLADQTYYDQHGTLTNMNTSSAWVTGKANCMNSFSSYLWQPGSLATQSIIVAPGSNTIYSVTVGSNFSCLGTSTQTITVNPNPTIIVNSGAICTGGSFTITPSGADTYTFLNGSTVVSPTTTSSYSITGTSALGCAASGPGISNVTVNSLPVLNIGGVLAVCSGSTATQTVSGADTYMWSTGSTSTLISISPTIATTYSVTGTNTLTGCSNTTSKIVSVGYPPVISVNSGNICAGAVFTMMPNGASTYTFSDGASIVSSTVSPTVNSSYFVSGTSSLGCVSTSSAISNVIINPAPVIVVNSGAVCAGNVFSMTPTGASTYTYSNGASTVIPVSNNSYTITGTDVLGCVSAVPAVANVTVNPLPVVSASNGTVCSGNNYSIVASGAATYTYMTSGGPSSSWVSPLVSTTYSITGTSSLGCSSSNTQVIVLTVAALPTISVNSGTVCAGSVFTMVPSGASTYTYSTGASTVIPFSNAFYTVMGTNSLGCVSAGAAVANVILLATPVVTVNSGVICAGGVFTMVPTGAFTYTYSSLSATVSPATNSNYTVSGTSAQGCVSSNVAISNVVVYSNPSPAILGNTVICNGESTTLYATGATSYMWNTNATGATQIVSPVTNTTYIVTGASANGCVNSASVSVVVNQLPLITLNNGTVCPSSPFVIVPSGALTYTYSAGSNTVSPVVTTSYSVTGTDANGCVSVIPAVTTITVINAISISAGGTTLVCAGEPATLSVNGASTYTWSSGQNTSTIITSPTVNATYTVIGANGTCADTAFISVQVNSLPIVSALSTSSLLCTGETATLTTSGANTYLWSGGETTTFVVINPIVTTNYTVTGVDANGCSNKATVTQNVSDCLGIESREGFTAFVNLYPNPNNGEFVVETSGSVQMRVLNSIGQVIIEKQLHENKNGIMLEGYAKGIYFIEFRNTGLTKTIKVIKQ